MAHLSLICSLILILKYYETGAAPAGGHMSHVLVRASPTNIQEGFTKHLEVNCTFSHDHGAEFHTIWSLILSKNGSGHGSGFTDVARVTSSFRHTKEFKESLGAHVIGELASTGESHISLKWTYPPNDAEGTYKCTAHGNDVNGRPVVRTAEATVTYSSVDDEMIVEKLKEIDMVLNTMQRQVEELQHYQSGMESRLDNSRAGIMASTATYHGRSYFLSHPMQRNMAVADSMCRLYGGYLVEADDNEEFNYVANFVYSELSSTTHVDVGLGSGDEGHEGTWTFRHSAVNTRFLSWAQGEPNGGHEENCLYLSGKLMYDRPCAGEDLVRFVCEMPA